MRRTGTDSEELYRRYSRRVYRYMLAALADPHDAEDAAQQVFLNLHRALQRPGAPRPRHPDAWVFTVARHQLISLRRRSEAAVATDPRELPENPRSDERPPPGEWIRDPRLRQAVEALPEAQRSAIVMRYRLDLRADEIATVLDRSPDAVRQLQRRGTRVLRERLGVRRQTTRGPG